MDIILMSAFFDYFDFLSKKLSFGISFPVSFHLMVIIYLTLDADHILN